MKKPGIVAALTLIISLGSFNAEAQKTKTTTKTTVKTPAAPAVKPEISEAPLTIADKMPTFAGGNEAVENYFIKAFEQTPLKEPVGITLNLVIDQTGKVTAAKIKNGYKRYENGTYLLYPEIDKQIEEAALKMPGWNPGIHKNKPVTVQQDVYFTLMNPGQTPVNSETIFVSVNGQPEFPGGEVMLKEYLKTNLQYPEDMKKQQLEGTVIVQFVVTRYGTTKDARILKGLSPSIDAETLRLIAAMPQWIPGRQNGQPVHVRMTIPVQVTMNR